jgi:acyl carrier protein
MYEKFVELLVEELQIDRDDITMEAELSNDLGINSIELFELAAQFEDKFGIEINQDDINTFNTVGDVVRYLESL